MLLGDLRERPEVPVAGDWLAVHAREQALTKKPCCAQSLNVVLFSLVQGD